MESKKLVLIVPVFVIGFLILVGVFLNPFGSKQNASLYYSQGLEFYKKQDYQNAYYNFSKISPTSDLFLNAVYRQAKSADAIEDRKTAIKKYKMLLKITKDKSIAPFALWRLGQLNLAEGKQREAKKNFLKLKNNYKDSEYGIASNYMLSKTETDPEKRKELLLEYIKYSPKGKYSKDVLTTILSDKEISLNPPQKTIVANCLYENEAYFRAVELLKEVPIDISWISLIKSLDKLNSPDNILKVGERGFSLNNSHFDEDMLEVAVSIYISRYPKGKHMGAIYVYDTAVDKRIKGIALHKIILSTRGEERTRKRIKLYKSFPDSKYAPVALYHLFIDSLTAGRVPNALKYGKLHLNRYKDKDITPAVLYYVALLKKKTMDLSYRDTLGRLTNEYPHSYYTYRAYSSIINPHFSNKRNAKVSENKSYIEFPKKEEKVLAKFFENFAEQEDYDSFDDFRIKDEIIRSWIEYKKGNRALSSVLARDYIINQPSLPKRSDVSWKLSYPIYYPDEVNYYSRENNLNPYLILSLIKEESHFNPSIRSGVGATGLMQIMPATASMISGERHTGRTLIAEDLNIKLGTKYFSHLMEIFSNNEPLCVLSYNSGPNAVKSWLKDHGELPFDLMVENIPYKETKDYIKKVYAAYWNYMLTYEGIKI